MIESKEAGWKVLKKEVIGELHLMTIETTSLDPNEYTERFHDKMHNELIEHTHRLSSSVDLFTFDHQPTEEEIEEAVVSRGFNPVIQSCSKPSVIRSITDGKLDVLEYGIETCPDKYFELFNMIPIHIEEPPATMALKGDWLYLYYVNKDYKPPSQFFNDKYILYSVRIHKDTGEIRRKGYHRGLVLDVDITDTLEGFDTIENIIGTGIFLDENRVTIYYMKSSDEKDYVEDLLIISNPYYGTTWENGKIIRKREYTKVEIEDV